MNSKASNQEPESNRHPPHEPPSSRRRDELPVLVVGIGGSAGAFDALKHILSRIPPDSGMAFVVVKHIDARASGALVDSLARQCSLPVQAATDGLPVLRDRIYVAGAGSALGVREGVLHVRSSARTDTHGDIDAFLCSLADDQRDRAVGILLSGLGSDGVAGLRAVRSFDGLTIAQSPESALYDTLPEASISAGVADLVLPVEDMPSALLQHLAGRREEHALDAKAQLEEVRQRLPIVADTLLKATGHDFSRYKEGTLTRRVRRRIDLLQLKSADEYVGVLRRDPAEAERLFKDLLIGVSQLFRDPEAFEALSERVIPRILDGRGDDVPVRVWVPGCASGEEAYSLAIVLREKLLARGSRRLVQIFATDIDVGMLAIARRGRYPLDIEQHVSVDRLEQFFLRDAQGYEVRPELREMTIFSVHNVVRDPPFSSLDLVSCRNLLIYLKADLQRRLVPMFHYALRAGGFLFLGPSEGLAAHPDLFETIDKRHRIFKRDDTAPTPAVTLPHLRSRAAWGQPAAQPEPRGASVAPLAARTFERVVLEEFAPATVAVDTRGAIVFVAGKTSKYLQPPPGAINHNLFDHVRRSLRRDIRAAVEESARTFQRAVRDGVRAESDGSSTTVRVTVRPLPAMPPHGPLFAVVIEDTPSVAEPAAPPHDDESLVDHLEAELHATRAELQAAIEELESANEELRSSNEELVSTNEELQSANEEMQTSREELQSANEELETLNADLHEKAAALSEANDYLQNLLAATQIATIFLDARLRITKYTPAARSVFRLIETDVGRALEDLAPKVEVADLVADCRKVLAGGDAIERQVRTVTADRWYAARFLPYRRLDGSLDGVVVTFVDITDLKTTEDALRLREADTSRRVAEFDTIFDAMSFPIIVFDGSGKPVRANRTTRQAFGVLGEDTDASNYWQLGQELRMRSADGTLLLPEQRASARALRGEAVHDLQVIVESPIEGDRTVELTAIPIRTDGEVSGAVLGWRDVTEKVGAERALREQQRMLEAIIDGTPSYIFLKDTQGRFITINKAVEQFWGMTREQVRGKTDFELPTRVNAAAFREQDDRVLRTASPLQYEQQVDRADGSRRTHLVTKFPLRDTAGKTYAICGFAVDITDRKAAEEERLAVERQMLHAQKLESLGVLAGGIAHDFNNLLLAILGNLDLVRDEVDAGSPIRAAMDASMQSARRAAELARQMLAFAGKGAFLITHIDLRQVVQENVDLIRASIPKAVSLRLHLSDQIPCVEADAGQIQQIVLNLITNAAESIGERGGAVDVTATVCDFDKAALKANRTEVDVAAGRYACLDVVDDGSGMTNETSQRVFDPFFSTKGAGRGLGMAALLGITRAHRGAILVDTEPGKGTRVRVLLPLCSEHRAPTLPGIAAEPAQVTARAGRVLVVDDEEAIRVVCSRIVQRLGYETLTAADGIEAVDVFRQHHEDIACVILDMSMPRMGGIAALDKLKAINKDVPVIMSSGFSEQQLEEVARAGQLAAFITKPYDIRTLSRVLAGAIGQRVARPS